VNVSSRFPSFPGLFKVAHYTVEQFRETDKQRIYVYAITKAIYAIKIE